MFGLILALWYYGRKVLSRILEILASFIIRVISRLGYPGIVLTMAIESACIPLPSEIIMPFSGYLVSVGRFNLWLAAAAGALGCLLGSLASYVLGFFGQEVALRRFIRRWGKYLLISEHELDRSEAWFRKYGEIIVFTSRLMPAVRTFISLPAGIAKMEIKKFIFYTTTGSFIWSLGLAYLGLVLGQNWYIIGEYFRKFDAALVVLAVLLLGVFLYKKKKVSKPA